jgi:hypothetical protein
MTVSTAATLVSLLLSTAVLWLWPRIGFQGPGRWSGLALIGAYVLAIALGGSLGAITSFLLTRKLLPRNQKTR